MGQSGKKGRDLHDAAEWVWGDESFLILLCYEILVSLRKRYKGLFGDLKVLKVFVVYKLYPKFSFVTVGAVYLTVVSDRILRPLEGNGCNNEYQHGLSKIPNKC